MPAAPRPSSPKAYLTLVLGLLAAALAVQFACAVLVDPFKVFGFTDFNRRNFEPNTRWLKVEWLKAHGEADSFIFGNSRVNAYDVASASRRAGGRFYNMTSGGATNFDIEARLNWLLARRPVRHVILALDMDTFAPVEANAGPAVLPLVDHPDVTGRWRISALLPYLWVDPRSLAVAVYGNLFKPATWYSFDVTTGHYALPEYDRQMAADPEGNARDRFQVKDGKGDETPARAGMAPLGRMIAELRRRDVPYTVLLNPLNHRLLNHYDPAALDAWKAEVAAIAGTVWDFARPSAETNDDRLYYEGSHFVTGLGDLVLDRIFSPAGSERAQPPAFGVKLGADGPAR